MTDVMAALSVFTSACAGPLAGWCKPLVEREPGGLGWLAGCYTAAGMAAEAEATLVAATKVKGATADDWSRLALFHAAANKREAMDAALTAAREPFYRECADFVIDTGEPSSAAVAGAILTAWNGSTSTDPPSCGASSP